MTRLLISLFLVLWVAVVAFPHDEATQAGSHPPSSDGIDPVEGTPYRYLSRFSPFEPMYFSVGWRERTNARFQFSFRYRFVNPEGALAKTGNWFNDFHFGYSQTSIWDLDSDSKPFFDTSYKPSLFFLRQNVDQWSSQGFSVGLQTGVEHESNGQAGAGSRDLNIVFVRPIFRFDIAAASRLIVAPKVFFYVGDLTDNPDIADYRGHVELEVAWVEPDRWKVASTLRKGTKGGAGSVQLDVTYPFDRLLGGSFDAFIHLQYFAGWGESLRTYDQKGPAQIRLGLMLVR